LDALQRPSLCEPELLAERVTTRAVDMKRVPDNLQGFDFCWSACALEHLGTLEAGMQFVERSLACLAPAGVAVHTMEFNVMSEEHTIESGPTVLYRPRDIVELVHRIQSQGYEVAPLDLDTG